MSLKDLMNKTKVTAKELGDKTQGKVDELLNEYKKAMVVLETLGYTVSKFNVVMGALPEIHTSITGEIKNIQKDRIEKMIQEHQAESLLCSMLNALVTAKQFLDYVELKLTSFTLHVKLGILPKFDVEMH